MAARRGSGTWAQTAWGPACDRAPKATVTIAPGVDRLVHRDAVPAFEALAAILAAHRYAVRPADTGAYNCRATTGGTSPSLHSWPIAIDVNWNTNPFRPSGPLVTDMPRALVDAVLAVRTKRGVRVWEWGGDWSRPKDAMHFGLVCSRSELGAGIDWATVRQRRPDPKKPSSWPTLRRGSSGPTVAQLQRRLTAAGHALDDDGHFGALTAKAVSAYQRERGLEPDGVVGLQTWTALLSRQPPLAAGEPSPVKRDRRPDRRRTPRPPLIRRPGETAVYLVAEQLLVVLPEAAFAALGFRNADVREVDAGDSRWELPVRPVPRR